MPVGVCCLNSINGSLIFFLLFHLVYLCQSVQYGPREETDLNGPSHTILKLNKRDDELARQLASNMGMVIKVSIENKAICILIVFSIGTTVSR